MKRTFEKTSFGDQGRQTNLVEMHQKLKELSASEASDQFSSFSEAVGEEGFVEESEEPVERRDFMKLMGASMALAGVAGCTRQPEERIVPYVDAPEEIVPGKPLFYATAYTQNGYATGLLAESHMGRPTKVEGNPEHPASLGATNSQMQASVLSLYDPDRSQAVQGRGQVSSWTAFKSELGGVLDAAKASDGEGIHLVLRPHSSPVLKGLVEDLISGQAPKEGEEASSWSKISVHYYEPINRDNARKGARLAFGEVVDAVYEVEKADVVFSLDADFLTACPGQSLRNARQYSNRRRVVDGAELNRVYQVESMYTPTGVVADHRLPVKPSRVAAIGAAVAAKIGAGGSETALSEVEAKFVENVVADLQAAKGKSLAIAGEQQPPEVHALAHAINQALGNVGETVSYIESPVTAEDVDESFARLVDALGTKGKVKALFLLDVNPVYDAPVDVEFESLLANAETVVHLGQNMDETGEVSHWHIPLSHYLEQWDMARAFDGTLNICQPLIMPLYASKSVFDVVSFIAGKADQKSHKSILAYCKELVGEESDPAFRKFVHDGFLAGSAFKAKSVKAKKAAAAEAEVSEGLEITFLPDPNIFDGSVANNPWLQEAPKPVSTLVWDTVVFVSPATSKELKASVDGSDDRTKVVPKARYVSLKVGEHQMKAVMLIQPGHADNAVTVYLGGGRRRAGKVGTDVGFNFYKIRSNKAGLSIAKVNKFNRVGGKYPLALLQDHHQMEGRNHVRSTTVKGFKDNPRFAKDHHEFGKEYTLYGNKHDHLYTTGNQWGMVIDLNTCIGCNTCTVACQAENNIATVGKQECLNGRELHWIRVDRYYSVPGSTKEEKAETIHDPNNVKAVVMPVTCFQCENAPCETVCPVGATVHSNEGLNQMVYNRCVGTRYCSNNCPYKVRRFNFFKYQDDKTEVLKMQRNPDVTVRLRGVMEKCTYCVQRINKARIDLKVNAKQSDDVAENIANRAILGEGAVETACQQACPTNAITFGNLHSPGMKDKTTLVRLKEHELSYSLLNEINTRPRTSYLARIRNNNENLEATPEDHGHHGGGHGGGHDDHDGHDDHKKSSHDDHGHADKKEAAEKGSH